MRTQMIIRGLPKSLAADGWWLSSVPRGAGAPPARRQSGFGETFRGPDRKLWGLALLVFCSDLLFWDHPLGLSLAGFSLLVYGVATLDRPLGHRKTAGGLIVLVGALPTAEFVQGLSVSFLLASLLCGIVLVRLPGFSGLPILTASLGVAARLPGNAIVALSHPISLLFRQPKKEATEWLPELKAVFRNWAFPIGGALVFLSLLLDANPVLSRILSIDLDVMEVIERILFWIGMAALLWPLLDRGTPEALSLRPYDPNRLPALGINRGSVFRALGLFNVVIGVQTVLDLSIFIGGAELPDGMTYASYAHRGAYPLLITALLAGCFALASRPFLGEHRLIRPLMYVWLAQNVLLCLSALFRLELYIEAYGLTYLRIYAVIWMLLVAAGLCLIGVQVAGSRSNAWLMLRLGIIAAATLYAASFVNFADVIARKNVGKGHSDGYYLCSLGPMASAALVRAQVYSYDRRSPNWMDACHIRPPEIAGWRDWSFRKWRVAHNVAAAKDSM